MSSSPSHGRREGFDLPPFTSTLVSVIIILIIIDPFFGTAKIQSNNR